MAGLLDETHKQYYEGNNHGSYQFLSLKDIITQFMIVYTGEDKILSKVRRMDVAFHAQRALAELSFDTFKSCKAQEITVPPSLQMILPHDYVNYTKISWSDSSGIKHRLYPTLCNTSNPFNITQDADGNYVFPSNFGLGENMDFDSALSGFWNFSTPSQTGPSDAVNPATGYTSYGVVSDTISIVNDALSIKQYVHQAWGHNQSKIYAVWQELDVTGIAAVEMSAVGTTQALSGKVTGGTLVVGICLEDPNIFNQRYRKANPSGSIPGGPGQVLGTSPLGGLEGYANCPGTGCGFGDISYWNFQNYNEYPPVPGVLLTTTSIINSSSVSILVDKGLNQDGTDYSIPWALTETGAKAKIQWDPGESSISKSLVDGEAIDLAGQDKVWVLVTSRQDFTSVPYVHSGVGGSWSGGCTGCGTYVPSGSADEAAMVEQFTLFGTNSIDDIHITTLSAHAQLSSTYGDSSETWENYKSSTPSANQDDYIDDTYWPASGSRYGLDPQHAQTNGSFYIDCISGKIHFSSNIAGKTVILDYISDSLGTDEEMMVHKFAEEAMYKWIAHAILSTRANTQEYIINRFKKERFAAIRTAKLRLSNLKIEEITQIMRGKSKQIKH